MFAIIIIANSFSFVKNLEILLVSCLCPPSDLYLCAKMPVLSSRWIDVAVPKIKYRLLMKCQQEAAAQEE
jgi:hypothetical protein